MKQGVSSLVAAYAVGMTCSIMNPSAAAAQERAAPGPQEVRLQLAGRDPPNELATFDIARYNDQRGPTQSVAIHIQFATPVPDRAQAVARATLLRTVFDTADVDSSRMDFLDEMERRTVSPATLREWFDACRAMVTAEGGGLVADEAFTVTVSIDWAPDRSDGRYEVLVDCKLSKIGAALRDLERDPNVGDFMRIFAIRAGAVHWSGLSPS